MPLDNFKTIEKNKGYYVNKKDRAIFQKGFERSFFGQGYSDIIEFILYDLSDNQLPQASVNGETVRYIYVSEIETPKIREYFVQPDITNNTTEDFRKYVINLEKLIKEAGYTNGIFKTQVTLLNRRVGTETDGDINNKLWIEEISPSRTEIRVIPIRNPEEISDLEKRYKIFVNESNFRDDTIYYVKDLLDSIDTENIKKVLRQYAGDVENGDKFINLIKTEFQIQDLDRFLLDIKDDIFESLLYFYTGNVYDRSSLSWGLPLVDDPDILDVNETLPPYYDPIELSIDTIKKILDDIIRKTIDFHLITREEDRGTRFIKDSITTIDILNDVIKTNQNFFNTSTPFIRGCTNPKANNYNPAASEDDGSCDYTVKEIFGCTNQFASNYNQFANVDDGSCKYTDGDTRIYYIWSYTATIKYKTPGGIIKTIVGKEYERITINLIGEPTFVGDVRSYPKVRTEVKTVKYRVAFSPKKVDAQTPATAYFSYKDVSGNTVTRSLKLNEGVVICIIEGSLVIPQYFQGIPLGDCD
jgi:hypothetical protein